MTSTHVPGVDRGVRSMTEAVLPDEDQPTHWYDLAADLPAPVPPSLHPGTGQPPAGEDMAPLFPAALIEQEMTTERFVPIPEPVRDVYRLWRPSPLYRAHRLERALGTPARICTSTRRQPGRQPRAEHRRRPGVLQRRGGRPPADDRDRPATSPWSPGAPRTEPSP